MGVIGGFTATNGRGFMGSVHGADGVVWGGVANGVVAESDSPGVVGSWRAVWKSCIVMLSEE
ncbi:MAG: hypothetical protein C0485_16785 [Pirellula sp.]|nr:hypothetical protein [Pirellula sp.]